MEKRKEGRPGDARAALRRSVRENGYLFILAFIFTGVLFCSYYYDRVLFKIITAKIFSTSIFSFFIFYHPVFHAIFLILVTLLLYSLFILRSDIAEQSGEVSQSVSGPILARYHRIFFCFFIIISLI
jgi:hypothetical protein